MGFEISDLADFGEIVNAEGSASVAPREMDPDQVARRTAQQLQLYQDVGKGVAEGVDCGELVNRIMNGAVQILGYDRVVYFQAVREEKLLRPAAWGGAGSQELAGKLELPLTRTTGALALSLLEHRPIHVPQAHSKTYGDLAGETLLAVARCTGYAVAPVISTTGVIGVLYGDCGPEGPDVVAEQAHELQGLALQLGLVLTGPKAGP
jgi:hypothetical protein